MDDWWTSIRSGMWKLNYQLSAEGRRRYYDEMLPILDQTKVEVMGQRDKDSYYLVYIGTKPNAQGRGYAGKLIRDMVAKASCCLTSLLYNINRLINKIGRCREASYVPRVQR